MNDWVRCVLGPVSYRWFVVLIVVRDCVRWTDVQLLGLIFIILFYFYLSYIHSRCRKNNCWIFVIDRCPRCTNSSGTGSIYPIDVRTSFFVVPAALGLISREKYHANPRHWFFVWSKNLFSFIWTRFRVSQYFCFCFHYFQLINPDC